jgi:DNA-binding MarR family transcriptional regulator
MSGRETAELLLLAGRLVQAEGYDGELSPAQWMALRYFARANPFSRTPSAFAEFQATTRGTASQAIKALEADGYLVRHRSKADGRSVSLRLTNKGKKALARDPFEVLVRAVDLLDAKERTEMHHTLHKVLATLAASGAHRRFGVLLEDLAAEFGVSRERVRQLEVRAFEKVQRAVKNGVAVMEAPALCRRISFQPCLVMGKLPDGRVATSMLYGNRMTRKGYSSSSNAPKFASYP